MKSDHREELSGFYQTKMSLLVKYFSHISMRFSLYKRPSCQTFSNALDKSRKTTLTSNDGFASNAL